MLGPRCKYITVALLFTLATATSFASLNCPSLHYFNGTHCAQCTKCTPGFGVRTNCTTEKDTDCQACFPRHDYSNTTGLEPCIHCHTYSNCLEGAFKVIKNCTIFGPYVCDGCAEGYYFDPSSGVDGACTRCRQPCKIWEEERRTCKTEHNRMCVSAKKPPPTARVSSNPTRESNSTENREENRSRGATVTEVPELDTLGTTPIAKETPTPTLKENLWYWIGLTAVILLTCVPIAIKWKGQREKKKMKKTNKKKKGNVKINREGDIEMQKAPLMRSELGLDCLIQDIPFAHRKSIVLMLNGKDSYGYFYWRIVAERLGFSKEWRAWESSENPTELLLTTYGERSGSTITALITALKDVELTKFADDIEKMFATPPP